MKALKQPQLTLHSTLRSAVQDGIRNEIACFRKGRCHPSARACTLRHDSPLKASGGRHSCASWVTSSHGGFRNWYKLNIVLLARLLPGVRSLISLPAGLTGMPFGRFLIYTLLGTALWNSMLITCGLLLGHNWNLVTYYVESYQLALAVIAVLFIIGVVAARLRNRKSKACLD